MPPCEQVANFLLWSDLLSIVVIFVICIMSVRTITSLSKTVRDLTRERDYLRGNVKEE